MSVKETLSKTLKIGDVLMRFHAVLSDADGRGDNIVETYARKENVKILEEQSARQNAVISQTTNAADAAKQKSDVAISKVAGIGDKVITIEDRVLMLQAELTAAKEQIKNLESTVAIERRDKGVFVNIPKLFSVNPKVGDYALLLAPKEGVELEEYYGDLFVGNKTEHLEDWAEKTDNAKQYVYVGTDNVVYQVTKDVPFSTLVELHHIDDSELVSDGTIKAIEFGGNPNIVTCTVDNIWEITDTKVSSFEVSNNVDADHVKDGSITQKDANLTTIANNIVANGNLDAISKTLNDVVATLNELQRCVVIQEKSDKLPHFIPQVSVTNYKIVGEMYNNLVGISPMPIVLGEE